MDRRNALAILPEQKVGRTSRGGVILPTDFIDGMRKYVEHWCGPVTALMEPMERSRANLDEVAIDPAALPFQITIGSYSDPHIAHHLAGRDLVLGCVSHRQNHLARLCRRSGSPLVYVAENTLDARLQLAWSSAPSAAVAIRRHCWELDQERQHREAISRATGVQCNGAATYEAYRGINPNAFLFFDAPRVQGLLISDDELESRLVDLSRGRPLRLLFSGRLTAVQGGDHLIRVANELRRMGTAFELTIHGGRIQAPQVRAEVERLGLGDLVKFVGDFHSRSDLTPGAKREADLFVCSRRPSDSSCSYLEAMAGGTPIIGYGNEALAGMVRESGAGWATEMERPIQLASKIAELASDRQAVADASRRALAFARLWTFEETFKARIEHLKSCAAMGLADQGWGGRLAGVARNQLGLEDRRLRSR